MKPSGQKTLSKNLSSVIYSFHLMIISSFFFTSDRGSATNHELFDLDSTATPTLLHRSATLGKVRSHRANEYGVIRRSGPPFC